MAEEKQTKDSYISGMRPSGARKLGRFVFGDRYLSMIDDKKNHDFVFIVTKDEEFKENDEYFKDFWKFKITYKQ